MVKKLDVFAKVFGLYLIALSVLAIANAFAHPEIASPLWFCYLAVMFIGIGLFYKWPSLIAVQVNIMTIPILVWNIDFYHYLITGNTLWGITNYFFISKSPLSNFITIQHLYVLPIALIFLYFFRSYKRGLWKWSFLEAAIMFILVWFFTFSARNVNCVFNSCINFFRLSGPIYQLFWFFSVFLMASLTNNFFSYLMEKINKNKKRKK